MHKFNYILMILFFAIASSSCYGMKPKSLTSFGKQRQFANGVATRLRNRFQALQSQVNAFREDNGVLRSENEYLRNAPQNSFRTFVQAGYASQNREVKRLRRLVEELKKQKAELRDGNDDFWGKLEEITRRTRLVDTHFRERQTSPTGEKARHDRLTGSVPFKRLERAKDRALRKRKISYSKAVRGKTVRGQEDAFGRLDKALRKLEKLHEFQHKGLEDLAAEFVALELKDGGRVRATGRLRYSGRWQKQGYGFD